MQIYQGKNTFSSRNDSTVGYYLIFPSMQIPLSWKLMATSFTISSTLCASLISLRCTTMLFPCVFSTIFMAGVEDKNESTPPIIISVPMPPSYFR